MHGRKKIKPFPFTSRNQQEMCLRASSVLTHVGTEFPSFAVTARNCDHYSELFRMRSSDSFQLRIFQSSSANYCPLHCFLKSSNHCWQHINNAPQFLKSLFPKVLDRFSTTLKLVCSI